MPSICMENKIIYKLTTKRVALLIRAIRRMCILLAMDGSCMTMP